MRINLNIKTLKHKKSLLFLCASVSLWFILCLFGLSPCTYAQDKPIVLTIYHTNDIHGWIMPRPERTNSNRLIGGVATLKALIDKDKGHKLIVDAGDWWQGTPEGSLSKGDNLAQIFNQIGYDAIEVGNHEFDAGAESLKTLITKINAPVLAANIYNKDGQHADWTKPHLIKTVAGVKIGIFGLLTTNMKNLAFPKNIEGLSFRREVDEARDQVAALKKEDAQIIIALTHVGFENSLTQPFEGDQTIAREVDGIDLIVGGHTHTMLYHAWHDPTHGTLVVQAGSYLKKVGRTTLNIDAKTHKLLSSSDELLDLQPALIGEDKKLKEFVSQIESNVGEKFNVVIATAASDLTRGPGNQESTLGSWMTDCYIDWGHVDVSFQNIGGIRSDLDAGPVTVRDIFNLMPFDNSMVKLQMTGDKLRSLLARGLSGTRLLQVGGLQVEYNLHKPFNERIVTVLIGKEKLDLDKTYSVTTIDFLVAGGDGYLEFASTTTVSTGVLARDVLQMCAEKQKTISPPALGRIKELRN